MLKERRIGGRRCQSALRIVLLDQIVVRVIVRCGHCGLPLDLGVQINTGLSVEEAST